MYPQIQTNHVFESKLKKFGESLPILFIIAYFMFANWQNTAKHIKIKNCTNLKITIGISMTASPGVVAP
jgi:hypothetical protein